MNGAKLNTWDAWHAEAGHLHRMALIQHTREELLDLLKHASRTGEPLHTVVEIGCGPGTPLSAALAERIAEGGTFVALDQSSRALAAWRETAWKASNGRIALAAIPVDLEDPALDLPAEFRRQGLSSIDAAVAMNCFQYVRPAALARIFCQLNAAGVQQVLAAMQYAPFNQIKVGLQGVLAGIAGDLLRRQVPLGTVLHFAWENFQRQNQGGFPAWELVQGLLQDAGFSIPEKSQDVRWIFGSGSKAGDQMGNVFRACRTSRAEPEISLPGETVGLEKISAFLPGP